MFSLGGERYGQRCISPQVKCACTAVHCYGGIVASNNNVKALCRYFDCNCAFHHVCQIGYRQAVFTEYFHRYTFGQSCCSIAVYRVTYRYAVCYNFLRTAHRANAVFKGAIFLYSVITAFSCASACVSAVAIGCPVAPSVSKRFAYRANFFRSAQVANATFCCAFGAGGVGFVSPCAPLVFANCCKELY